MIVFYFDWRSQRIRLNHTRNRNLKLIYVLMASFHSASVPKKKGARQKKPSL